MWYWHLVLIVWWQTQRHAHTHNLRVLRSRPALPTPLYLCQWAQWTLAVGGLPVQSHPGRVEVSLSKTPNPQLLLTSRLVPCMAANQRVCVNGWMRGINCTVLWIKVLNAVHLPFTAKSRFLKGIFWDPLQIIWPSSKIRMLLRQEDIYQNGSRDAQAKQSHYVITNQR